MNQFVQKQEIALLTDADPAPVEMVNPDSDAPLMLLCEHAGKAIPEALGDLGLQEEALESHIAWDIGAEAVARTVAHNVQAPLIIQRYSRLVIDANRPPETPTSIPKISGGVAIPGNVGLGDEERVARRREIFDPMDRAIGDCLDRYPRKVAMSIHSFTPSLAGEARPWHAGFLARKSQRTLDILMQVIEQASPGMILAYNEPYQIDTSTDWFIPVHAEPRGLAHALIEIRNDQIADLQGAERWSDLLTAAISTVLEDLQ